jgi:hypothetical protein
VEGSALFYQAGFNRDGPPQGRLPRYEPLQGGPHNEAQLTGANLERANLSGANLFVIRANLSGANLSGTTKLTQKQIEQAVGDAQTKLPDHLKRPAAWSRSSDEEPSRGA